MDEKEAETKRSLRNEKLKANRTSETEEQRKESLAKKIEREGELRERKGCQTQTITRKSASPLSKD